MHSSGPSRMIAESPNTQIGGTHRPERDSFGVARPVWLVGASIGLFLVGWRGHMPARTECERSASPGVRLLAQRLV